MRTTLLISATALTLIAGCKKDDDDPPAADPTPSPTPTGIADIDGNYYDTLTIGGLTWFTENLRVRRYRNGDSIPYRDDNTEWYDHRMEDQCCVYQNDASLTAQHGLLYSSGAAYDARGLCPDGWHSATDEDWQQLEAHLGMPASELDSVTMPGPYGAWRGYMANVGGKLKTTSSLWDGPNIGADNSSGFSAMPSGERNYQGQFSGMGEGTTFWSAYPAQWMRRLTHDNGGVFRGHHGMGSDQTGYGHSCRCVKD